jgi:hypothetical protein
MRRALMVILLAALIPACWGAPEKDQTGNELLKTGAGVITPAVADSLRKVDSLVPPKQTASAAPTGSAAAPAPR